MPYRNNAQDRPKNEKNVVKEIVGLDTFRKHLERDFFAEARPSNIMGCPKVDWIWLSN